MKRILYTLGFLAASTLFANAQEVTTVIGRGTTGLSATGAAKDNASLNGPYGVAIHKSTGNIYITEEDSHMISIITNDKYYNRAGQFMQAGFADGAGAGTTRINSPRGIVVGDDGTVYFVDGGNNAIRKLSPFTTLGNAQVLTTIAGGGQLGGQGTAGYKEGTGLTALFDDPRGLAMDPTTGDLIVADYQNLVIRRVNPTTGVTSLVAGRPGGNATSDNGNGNATGPGGATFAPPLSVYVDAAGDIFVTQDGSYEIRKISGGKVTTVTDINVNNIIKGFDYPTGLTKAGPNWYFSVGCAIGKVAGTVSSLYAGAGDDQCGFQDGTGTDAMLFGARDIVPINDSNLLIVDKFNNRIRKLSFSSPITGVKESAIAGNSSFSVYPNPAQDYVMIERKASVNEKAVLSVYDVAGKEVISENISASGNAHRLSLDNFKKGVYIMKLQSGTDISTTKLVVK